MTPQPIWSTNLRAAPRGLALASESAACLVWDRQGWLYLFNQHGVLQAQYEFPDKVAGAVLEATGASAAVLGAGGLLRFFGPDLAARGDVTLAAAGLAVAMDPLGTLAAVSVDPPQLFIVDPLSSRKSNGCLVPRPLLHLALAAQRRVLVGCADFGLLIATDLAGNVLWRETPMANIGSLSIDATGDAVLGAMFSDGIMRWNGAGRRKTRLATPHPCRLAAQSHDGRRILGASAEKHWWLHDEAGIVSMEFSEAAPIVAAALSPLGDRAWVAVAHGSLVCYDLSAPC